MSDRTLVVAVTGGQIDPGFEWNTSELVRDALPHFISRDGKPRIEIMKYPHGTVCTYALERELTRKLWSGHRFHYDNSCAPDELVVIDLMLHMGMRTWRKSYDAECLARRDVFPKPGDDGKYFPTADLEEGGIWHGLPAVLSPVFDIDAAVKKISDHASLKGVDIQSSENAGAYFCEFEFYSSLAELYKSGKDGIVEFLHIPEDPSPEAIQTGVKVAVALICELLDQRNDNV